MKMFSANVRQDHTRYLLSNRIENESVWYALTLLSCTENLELKTIVFSIAESVGFYSLDSIL